MNKNTFMKSSNTEATIEQGQIAVNHSIGYFTFIERLHNLNVSIKSRQSSFFPNFYVRVPIYFPERSHI